MSTFKSHVLDCPIVPDVDYFRHITFPTFKDNATVWIRRDTIWRGKPLVPEVLRPIHCKADNCSAGRVNPIVVELTRVAQPLT